jgi:hypothetical protein
MTLIIDTGAPQINPTQGVPDWFVDMMPEGTPPERIMHNYAYNLIGKLSDYSSMKFARKHLMMHWGFLSRLAEIHPEIFDEVLSAYAEVWAASK